MPIYTYTCTECERESTEFRRIAERDEVRTHHRNCEGVLLRGIDAPGAVWAPTSTGSNLK